MCAKKREKVNDLEMCVLCENFRKKERTLSEQKHVMVHIKSRRRRAVQGTSSTKKSGKKRKTADLKVVDGLENKKTSNKLEG